MNHLCINGSLGARVGVFVLGADLFQKSSTEAQTLLVSEIGAPAQIIEIPEKTDYVCVRIRNGLAGEEYIQKVPPGRRIPVVLKQIS